MATMVQRLAIVIAAATAGAIWLSVRGPLGAPDGSTGLSVFSAMAHPVAAALLMLAAGLPAAVLAVMVSATGHPLSGVFSTAAGLGVLAAATGPIDGYLRRMTLPEGFGRLGFEVLLLFVGWGCLLAVLGWVRGPIRDRLPKRLRGPHIGGGLGRLDRSAALAGLVCAVVGGVLANVLIQSSDSGQVIGSLVLAFALGGMAGQMALGPSNPTAILLSPAVVAIVAYWWVMIDQTSGEQVLATWYAGKLPGAALALPIHYASAAVAGCALGIGWAQTMIAAKQQESGVSG